MPVRNVTHISEENIFSSSYIFTQSGTVYCCKKSDKEVKKSADRSSD